MDILKRISSVPVAQIENVVTAENICRCRNPLERAFEVNTKVLKKSTFKKCMLVKAELTYLDFTHS